LEVVRSLLTFVTCFVAAGCAHAPAAQAPSPTVASPQRGPDGRYHNPPEWPAKTSATNALKWRLTPHERVESEFTPPYQANDGAALRQNGGKPSITWIGHATVLLQSGGVNVLTDPHFGPDTGKLYPRLEPPGVAIRDLPPIDVVVISHNHRDHLDDESVRALRDRFGDRVTFVVPLGLKSWFGARKITNVTELDWWQATEVRTSSGATAHVTMVPAQHWSQRGGNDRNRTLWGGYVLDAGGHRFYFAGDTGYPAAFAEIGKRFPNIEYALLPIGCYAPRWFMHPQHMSPEDAARAFRDLGAQVLLPIHWATFQITEEPMEEPPQLLYAAMGKLANRILFLPIGGTFWPTPHPTETGTGTATASATTAPAHPSAASP
jgi:N-acyl-phosphatidylethanolamine-hydrolysing phospholipase D